MTDNPTNPASPETPPPATPAGGPVADPADVEKNKVMAILGYIIFFIPLLAAKDSPFAKYHANQGLILFALWAVTFVVFFIGGAILRAVTMGIGTCICMPLGGLVCLGILALAILGIINANNGKMVPLPVVGKLFTLIK